MGRVLLHHQHHHHHQLVRHNGSADNIFFTCLVTCTFIRPCFYTASVSISVIVTTIPTSKKFFGLCCIVFSICVLSASRQWQYVSTLLYFYFWLDLSLLDNSSHHCYLDRHHSYSCPGFVVGKPIKDGSTFFSVDLHYLPRYEFTTSCDFFLMIGCL